MASSSKTGGPKPRNGKVADGLAGDWDKNGKMGTLDGESGCCLPGGDIFCGVWTEAGDTGEGDESEAVESERWRR